ncbi:HlyD family type I secretion periplasmic adaptor subunit [Rhizobium sp. TRM95796]|uniref:HlyD family type I secretion periplasmic adaptor subunit n=1 Tax=Rhizobium sp. TRM95796 TaxID=2979862 RepID=UPI0021E8FF45|nr:HlyD family type I secretion periplasmic adaptor subunit [Rhizobium sp. TRM95796]MCV3769069.1 HlyD family type I secretion periplasmic adaptor subunit [Rhizobium sp. TRM95796]
MAQSIDITPADYRIVGERGAVLSDWNAVVREEANFNASLFRPTLLAFFVLVFGIGGFVVWAMFTDLVQASTASAKVIVESNTKTVTHAEGGTLNSLMVQEGQAVLAGDTLATLDATRVQAAVVQLKQQLYAYDIRFARLIAERDEKQSFEFKMQRPDGVDEVVALEWMATEQKLFAERQKQFATAVASSQLMIDQLRSERTALEARRQSWIEQAEVLKSDYETQQKLRKTGLTTKQRLNDVKLQYIDMMTRITESDAGLVSNKQKVVQAELAVGNTRNEYFRTISEQLQTVQAERARAEQDLVSAEHAVKQSTILSPQDGVIANIRVRTPGSALLAGQPLLDIVPANQALILEGQARAIDIDTLRVGEKVEIRLAAFSAADDLPLEGKVIYVAPDSIVNTSTGEATYTFRARIDASELKKRPQLFLYPGMTASVNIVNGTRTALAYLIQPIAKSFSQAFHEK